MKLKEALKKTQEINNSINHMPWKVWTCFWEEEPIVSISGSEVCFGADHKDLSELRNAVEWFASQFGGSVTWEE